MAPDVHWPTNGPEWETLKSALHKDAMKKSSRRQLVDLVRVLPWQVRPEYKGANTKSLYYTQASIYFLAFIDRASPLHKYANAHGQNLGEGWSKKHTHKALHPITLVRMGIAYPKAQSLMKSPRFGTAYVILEEAELRTWWQEIRCQLLAADKYGPYALCTKIFGLKGTQILIDRSCLKSCGPRPTDTVIVSHTASSSSIASGSKRTLDDIDVFSDDEAAARSRRARR
ncbi:hypothetical protein BV20DRAFT_984053 [Pilatotrama ljubarskyi]|nr:hypothetical protein BV20DRAFT_984053 [Pilatotrama ljubarskyi]